MRAKEILPSHRHRYYKSSRKAGFGSCLSELISDTIQEYDRYNRGGVKYLLDDLFTSGAVAPYDHGEIEYHKCHEKFGEVVELNFKYEIDSYAFLEAEHFKSLMISISKCSDTVKAKFILSEPADRSDYFDSKECWSTKS